MRRSAFVRMMIFTTLFVGELLPQLLKTAKKEYLVVTRV